jgi:N-acetylmuramoyl-L-alanine amidase-like protein
MTRMPRDLGLATRLRAAGLTVREVKGWKTRGDTVFHPKGAVTHHTAGAAAAPGRRAPSLGIVINGRKDLSGPLCNVYQDYDDVVYVVAAGRANHAGLPDGGVFKGMRGNSDAWGLEIEHPGTFPLTSKRIEVAARIQAAVIKGTAGPSMVVTHKEWAPSRKIDPATNFDANAFRHLVSNALNPPQPKHRAPWQLRRRNGIAWKTVGQGFLNDAGFQEKIRQALEEDGKVILRDVPK